MAQILLNNRFSILHLESTSNFSKVLFALDTYQNPPRNCTIKIYRPISQKNHIQQWITQQFQQEAHLLKQLSLAEPNLPEIYTYSHNAQGYYIVRELIEGLTLRKQVQAQGVFSLKMVKIILTKLLLTLENLHQQKVIHQNIRPKNIILRDSDHAPVSINFGSIKQIVATFDFHGEKNIFSLKDVLGYTASEQALGKAIPASDIYSLGLTAIYLLTAKDPISLSVDKTSGQYQIPLEIDRQDAKLAKVLAKAISLNPEDRYASAQEMLDDLFYKNPQTLEYQNLEAGINLSSDTESENFFNSKSYHAQDAHRSTKKSKNNLWIVVLAILVGCISLANLYLFLKSQKTAQEPENIEQNSELLAPTPEVTIESTNKTSILNDELKTALEIPIFLTGSPQKQLRSILGEPNAIKKGYWKNSSAWIYKRQGNGLIDLGYLFDLDTERLRQTEIAIAHSVDIATIEEILNSLLQGNLNQSVAQGLKQVYNRQINTYSFRSGNLQGSIELEDDDNIYIGIWEQDFH